MMKAVTYLLALQGLSQAAAGNVEMCSAGVCARVLGQSGKIDFTFGDQSVQVAMDSIIEVGNEYY
jgi:hypothetical protein